MTPDASFGLRVTSDGATRVMHAAGRLVTGAGADAPEWATASALGPLDHVLMDLGDVTAIDASGVGRLVGLHQALARRGTCLTITTASARVRRVLHLTGLDAIFGIAPGLARRATGLCRCA